MRGEEETKEAIKFPDINEILESHNGSEDELIIKLHEVARKLLEEDRVMDAWKVLLVRK